MDALDLYLYEIQKFQFAEKDYQKIVKLIQQIEKIKIQLINDTKLMEALSFQTKTPYVQFTMTKKILPSSNLYQFEGSPPEGALLSEGAMLSEGPLLSEALSTEFVAEANAAADNKLATSLPPM